MIPLLELGSGLSLDEKWDLYVDPSSGDLQNDTGSEELRKDLAFIFARALQKYVGEFIDDGRAADIRLFSRKLVLSDPRIDTVESLEVQSNTQGTELEIDVLATTVEGVTVDEVFTVA